MSQPTNCQPLYHLTSAAVARLRAEKDGYDHVVLRQSTDSWTKVVLVERP